MQFIDKPTSLIKLWENRRTNYVDLLKFAVDVENNWIAIDGEMHSDCETMLLEKGSKQEYVWGGNVYPENSGSDFIEFSSFINIRPSQDNPGMELLNPEICGKIIEIIQQLLLL